MYDELVKQCRDCLDSLCGDCKYERLQKPGNFVPCMNALLGEAADAIEEMDRRIGRAIELYNRNVEKTAMYEVLAGISPEPPKEEEE